MRPELIADTDDDPSERAVWPFREEPSHRTDFANSRRERNVRRPAARRPVCHFVQAVHAFDMTISGSSASAQETIKVMT
jgi:hypothetical protein